MSTNETPSEVFFKKMESKGVWAEDPVAQTIAWYLERDIIIISPGNTKKNLYTFLYGMRDRTIQTQYPPTISLIIPLLGQKWEI